MIVTLIIVCEIGFWVLLVAGLALRYLARMPRTGAAVLLCEPLLEVVLLVVTAVDLKNGAEPDWKHGLAAVYLGFTATHGHYLVTWADGHAAHRLGGGPRPVGPPRYGMRRALHEWKMAARAIGAAAIAAALLQAAVWYVGDPSQSASLREWQGRMGILALICAGYALTYTLWPKQPKKGSAGAAGSEGPARDAGHGAAAYGARREGDHGAGREGDLGAGREGDLGAGREGDLGEARTITGRGTAREIADGQAAAPAGGPSGWRGKTPR